MKKLLILFCFALLTGCSSGTYQHYYHSIATAYQQSQDIELSLEQINSSDVDYLLVTANEQAQVAMVLAFIDGPQQIWVGSDKSSLTLKHGRLIGSDTGANDILYLSNLAADPLSNRTQATNQSWQFTVDSAPNLYGQSFTANFTSQGSSQVKLDGQAVDAQLLVESVKGTNNPLSYENHYWFAKADNQLIKSIQYNAATQQSTEILFASRFARLLTERGNHD